jgi:hypothetical protein
MPRTPTLEELAKDVNKLNARVSTLMAYIYHLENKLTTGVESGPVQVLAGSLLPTAFQSGPTLIQTNEIGLTAKLLLTRKSS